LKFLIALARGAFILCLPVLLLTASLGGAVNSLWLYPHSPEKYQVKEDLAGAGLKLSDAELEGIYAALIGYFNSAEEYIDLTVIQDGSEVPLFTLEETIHFSDVKRLIWLDYWVLLGTLIYALAYAGAYLFRRKDRRQLARGVVGGSSLTLLLILGLVLLNTLTGFRQIFYQFHLLFFTNPYWSAQGYMLLLFPEPFFSYAALLCALSIVAVALILDGVSGGYLLFKQKADNN
jgi:integral membrane protein (TIGR01906 family)